MQGFGIFSFKRMTEERRRQITRSNSREKITERSSIRERSLSNKQIVRMPSESDYLKVIKKLDLVISNANYGTDLVVLNENNNLNLYLEKGKSQLIHVFTFAKPSPLHFHLDRSYGMIKAYISTKIPQPSIEIHDFSSKSDVIEVANKGSNLQMKRVAVLLYAASDCNVNVSVKFGGNLIKKTESLNRFSSVARIREMLTEDSLDMQIKLEKSLQKKKMRKRVKNYEEIKTRWKNNSKDRKKFLRKDEIGFEGWKTERTRIEDFRKMPGNCIFITKKLELIKIFLKTMILLNASQRIKFMIKAHKEIEQKKNKQIVENRFFKEEYKKWARNRQRLVFLEVCRINLNFFHRSLKCIHLKKSRKVLVQFIKESKLSYQISSRFDRFLKKSNIYIVILIQHEWRKYKILKKFRLSKLQTMYLNFISSQPKKLRQLYPASRLQIKSLLSSYYQSYLIQASKPFKSFDPIFSIPSLISHISLN